MYEQNNDSSQAMATPESAQTAPDTTTIPEETTVSPSPEVTNITAPAETPLTSTNFGSKVSTIDLPPLSKEDMADEIALENQAQPRKRRSFWSSFFGKGD